MRKIVLVIAVVASLALAGCAGSNGEQEVVHEDSYEVPSQTGFEIDLDVQEGDAIEIEASATGPMAWDFHRHDEAGNLVLIEEGSGDAIDLDHEAETSTTHSVFVQNQGEEEITVDITIRGDGELRNFQRL